MADGEDVRDLVPADDRIRLIHVSEGFNIGQKRNFGGEHANGEVIAVWDDDDYSAPSRISDQVGRLVESGKSVTGYGSMEFRGESGIWRYTGPERYAVGTSLCFWRKYWQEHPFPALHVGEDTEFVVKARDRDELITADAGDLMYATIHEGNSSPRNLTGSNWKQL